MASAIIIDKQTPTPDESEAAADHLNNPEHLGVTVRVKDVVLIVLGTALSGYIGLRVGSTSKLIMATIPIHATVLYGITSSYFATRRVAVAFTLTGTFVGAGLTALLGFLLTPNADNHRVLFKPIGWLIENVALKKIESAAGDVGAAAIEAFRPQEVGAEKQVEIWVRGGLAAGVTLASGVLGMFSVNLFRIATKRWN
eukprot:TRINITY_DN6668_c0_g1_i1.p1 TRINITY_DN6668_c0_g1~~TRINITY_DN6668_c0_g1_i1.p1  ORF type:complete len:198 (+),score=60.43 TRINITY_DN6668_c0_g1_i1:53-646(+)